jgi:class 3 adenylate cyclase/predicted ATPase
MQCPTCSAANPDGKKFCTSCGGSLVARCPACGGENPPGAKFCGDCGMRVDTEAGPRLEQPAETTTPEAERRQLTVMFCDLVGSTALSQELDPEDLGELIRDYQTLTGQVIKRYEGFIARYMGDGMLVYFGYPKAHEDDPARAVHSGLEIVRAMESLNVKLGRQNNRALAVRIGIATGRVVVGELIGKGAAEEAAVVGETPNLAARLQVLAEPDSVVIAQSTRQLVGGLFECADHGTHNLKGFHEPVRAWRVVCASDVPSRFDAQRTAGLTPLVGRTDEISLLLRRWQDAKDGDGQVVLLSGEPGIGKSRITEALCNELQAERHFRLRYYGSPYHKNSALHPFIAQLERVSEITRTDSPNQRLDKLESLLAQSSDNLATDISLIAALLSIPTDDRYAPLDLAPQVQKQKTLEAIESQLDGLAGHKPVLMVFEDAHWIDPTSLELLESLIDRVQDLPVLVIVNFRPEFAPGWTRFGHVTLLTLNHLGRQQCAEMVRHVTGGKDLPESVLAELVRKTQGIPLFVEQLTKSVLESDLLTEQADRYSLSGPLPDLVIPATLHDSLMARLDHLGEVKEIAQIGAVIGREFTHELLAAVWPAAEEVLRTGLNKLVQSELVVRRGEPSYARYRFQHALVQDAAYQSLLKKTKQRYHQRIAEVLEKQFAEIIETEPELLAYHYTHADLGKKAISYWQEAGEQAARRSANHEAISHFQKGLELLEVLPEGKTRAERELGFLIALGPALMATQGWDTSEAQDAYARARHLARETGHPAELFPAVWGLWLVAHAGGKAPMARELLQELFTLADSQEDKALVLQAHHAGGSTMCSDGELHRAQTHIETGISLYRMETHSQQALRYGGHDPCVCAHSLGALNQLLLGHLDRSRNYSKRAVSLAQEVGHVPSVAHSVWYRAELCQLQGDVREAGERAKVVLSLASEKGMAQYAAWATMMQGWALTVQGDTDKGIAQVRNGLATLRASGTRYHLPHRLAMLAQALAAAGEIDKALEVIDEVIAAGEETGERWFDAEARRLKAVLILLEPHPDYAKAENSLQRAVEVARKQDARFWELRAATNLARLWRDQGKRAEARDFLTPVYSWFTEGLDTADLKHASALLDELS